MSDNWQPGDLALCVRHYHGPDEWPVDWDVTIGGIYTVISYDPDYGGYLELAEDPQKYDPSGAGWDARCFRKIRPHKADEEDRETIRLLTGKPEQVPA